MDLYFPSMGNVYVLRSSSEPVQFATLVIQGRDTQLEPPVVTIDGEVYAFDEFNTDRTRMVMRDHAIKRQEAESQE